MRILSWNVNSIRARLPHLDEVTRRLAPDVLCVQETKVEDDGFPEEAIGDLGYRAFYFGQKTYNGVAILCRTQRGVDDVQKNLGTDAPDAQRRLIAATVDGVRVVNVYVPNGQAVGTPAFAYKLDWLRRLREELAERYTPETPLVVCGDFNVAPQPIDVHDPKKWEGQVLFHPDERAAIQRLLDWGLTDSFRAKHPEEKGQFSWWDYRAGGYRRNQGLRIDLALITRGLAERCTNAWIERFPRELERPSDHTPMCLDVDE
jgi:exodeoxyribonuclease-3